MKNCKILNDNFYDFLPTYFLESLDELKFKFRELLLPKTPKIVFQLTHLYKIIYLNFGWQKT